MKPTLFPDLVGQDVAKRKIGFFLDGYNASSYIPHLDVCRAERMWQNHYG